MKKRVFVWPRGITRIDVKPELAVAEGADRLAVDLDVGDEQNFLVVLPDAFGAGAQFKRRLLAAAEVAEIGRKTQLLVLADGLAAEHQHQMLAPGASDRIDRRWKQRLRQIDAGNFRAARRRQSRHRDVDAILHHHSAAGFASASGKGLRRTRRFSQMVKPVIPSASGSRPETNTRTFQSQPKPMPK